MRFDWEPRPKPEGMLAIERQQKRDLYTQTIQADLNQQATWQCAAHWQESSERKRALVESHLAQLAQESQSQHTISTTPASDTRPSVIDALKQEQQQKDQQLAEYKAAAGQRRAHLLDTARQLVIEQEQRRAVVVTTSLQQKPKATSPPLPPPPPPTKPVQDKLNKEYHHQIAKQIQEQRLADEAEHTKEVNLRRQHAEQLAQFLDEQIELKERQQALDAEAEAEIHRHVVAGGGYGVYDNRQEEDERQENYQRMYAAKLQESIESARMKREQEKRRNNQQEACLLFQRLHLDKPVPKVAPPSPQQEDSESHSDV